MKRVNEKNASIHNKVITDQGIEDVKKELFLYAVRYPNEDDINKTVESLRMHVPEKKTNILWRRLCTLLKSSKLEMTVISKLYWILTILIYCVSYSLVYMITISPITILLFICPLPIIFGFLEVFKGRESGMLEMKMTCKYKSSEILLSKTLLIMLFNIFVNMMLLMAFFNVLSDLPFWKITFILFTTIFMFNILALVITMRFSRMIALIINLFVWFVYAFAVVSNVKLIERLMDVGLIVYSFIMVIIIIAFVYQLSKLLKHYSTYERIEIFEINYR